jgi:sigma-B regulation protein RsbU (phosphoserine phosphatase)
MTLIYGRRFIQEAGLLEERASLERKAEETLSQEQLAPRRWAARLAPQDLPAFEGFEVGRVYEAGTGLMAGDFYDLFPVGPRRLAAVIGDVSGHGIEPSITAFQVKYLLRIFLRQYRDPAQALEELNVQISTQVRQEEFVSLCVAVVDEEAGTLRWASAGHPPAWMWHDGEVRPLRSTGPMLTLDDRATYLSREIPLDVSDLLLLYTDGLAEARAGSALFGEDRIAAAIRRDPAIPADVLCKSLLAAARDFATAPLSDDVAILAIRRV